jgi:hypothetical protein
LTATSRIIVSRNSFAVFISSGGAALLWADAFAPRDEPAGQLLLLSGLQVTKYPGPHRDTAWRWHSPSGIYEPFCYFAQERISAQKPFRLAQKLRHEMGQGGFGEESRLSGNQRIDPKIPLSILPTYSLRTLNTSTLEGTIAPGGLDKRAVQGSWSLVSSDPLLVAGWITRRVGQ